MVEIYSRGNIQSFNQKHKENYNQSSIQNDNLPDYRSFESIVIVKNTSVKYK